MADITLPKTLLSVHRLREVLSYDPQTGEFRWRRMLSRRVKIGSVAGSERAAHWSINIDGTRYLAHRLAWLYVTGSWPLQEIDHRDLDGLNNRWANLREATHKQNMVNRSGWGQSGVKGVTKKGNRFVAEITQDGKTVYLGSFVTPHAAGIAYAKAAKSLHGEFHRT